MQQRKAGGRARVVGTREEGEGKEAKAKEAASTAMLLRLCSQLMQRGSCKLPHSLIVLIAKSNSNFSWLKMHTHIAHTHTRTHTHMQSCVFETSKSNSGGGKCSQGTSITKISSVLNLFAKMLRCVSKSPVAVAVSILCSLPSPSRLPALYKLNWH